MIALLAVAALLGGHSPAQTGCAETGYSHAGVQAAAAARGLSARIATVRAARVTSGHVAAYVGVSHADAWLQIGVSVVQGGHAELYYEVAEQGAEPRYTAIPGVAATGAAHRFAVLETDVPDTWSAWVDGRDVSGPVVLPGSHGSWRPLAATESYDGGVTRCNAYTFQFSDLRAAAPTGRWRPLARAQQFADAGHNLWTTGAYAVLIDRG